MTEQTGGRRVVTNIALSSTAGTPVRTIRWTWGG